MITSWKDQGAAKADVIEDQQPEQMQLGSRSWSKCNLHVQTLGELLAKAQHLIPWLLSVHENQERTSLEKPNSCIINIILLSFISCLESFTRRGGFLDPVWYCPLFESPLPLLPTPSEKRHRYEAKLHLDSPVLLWTSKYQHYLGYVMHGMVKVKPRVETMSEWKALTKWCEKVSEEMFMLRRKQLHLQEALVTSAFP